MPDHVTPQVRLPDDVLSLLGSAPGIDRVELAGSRARGDALPQSDWDFKITTSAFAAASTPAGWPFPAGWSSPPRVTFRLGTSIAHGCDSDSG